MIALLWLVACGGDSPRDALLGAWSSAAPVPSALGYDTSLEVDLDDAGTVLWHWRLDHHDDTTHDSCVEHTWYRGDWALGCYEVAQADAVRGCLRIALTEGVRRQEGCDDPGLDYDDTPVDVSAAADWFSRVDYTRAGSDHLALADHPLVPGCDDCDWPW